MDDISITFLGTGAAIPPTDRFQSSVAVRHKFGLTIFDVGEGTQFNLRKFNVPIRKEIVIAISHLHSDHYQGLPGILASLSMLERREKVTILGPPGVHRVVRMVLKTFFINPTYELEIVEIEPNQTFRGKGYVIHTIKALHFNNSLSYKWQENNLPGKWDTTILEKYNVPNKLRRELKLGNTIEVGEIKIAPDQVIGKERMGRTIIYSGDTRPNNNLVEFARDADLLIHEGTYPSTFEQIGPDREHSTVKQAVETAIKSGAKKLAVTHIGTRILDFVEEKKITKQHQDAVIVHDGTVITLPFSLIALKNKKPEI